MNMIINEIKYHVDRFPAKLKIHNKLNQFLKWFIDKFLRQDLANMYLFRYLFSRFLDYNIGLSKFNTIEELKKVYEDDNQIILLIYIYMARNEEIWFSNLVYL